MQPRLSALTLGCAVLGAFAYGQQPSSPTPTAEQIQQLSALADEVKALLQSGDFTKASRQATALSAGIYKLAPSIVLTPQQQLERFEAITRPDPASRFSLDATLAKFALDAGQLGKAEAYARELLALAPQFTSSSTYGNALHSGNLILGRVALQRDHNLALAKSSLMAAAAVPSTPTLQKYGPNMALARDLLAAGERDTVLQFIAMFRSIWTEGQKKLDDWTALIQAGAIPDFGANLLY